MWPQSIPKPQITRSAVVAPAISPKSRCSFHTMADFKQSTSDKDTCEDVFIIKLQLHSLNGSCLIGLLGSVGWLNLWFGSGRPLCRVNEGPLTRRSQEVDLGLFFLSPNTLKKNPLFWKSCSIPADCTGLCSWMTEKIRSCFHLAKRESFPSFLTIDHSRSHVPSSYCCPDRLNTQKNDMTLAAAWRTSFTEAAIGQWAFGGVVLRKVNWSAWCCVAKQSEQLETVGELIFWGIFTLNKNLGRYQLWGFLSYVSTTGGV